MLGFKVFVETEGRQVEIANIDALRGLYTFIGTYLRMAGTLNPATPTTSPVTPTASPVTSSVATAPAGAVATPPRTLADTMPHRPAPRIPAPGLRVIDFAVYAAKSFGRPFTLKELCDRMTAEGWQTDATDKPNTVRSTIRNYPIFQSHQNGYWTLNASMLPKATENIPTKEETSLTISTDEKPSQT